QGPFPADTVFARACKGEFSAVLAMYHDQGLGPLKLIEFGQSVNVTLGLPIIRTSVDHGTGYDLVGTNKANPSSLNRAFELAVRLIYSTVH
ncbi:MAG: 4-hydroxythreonine-4-phosphate dehydrogenase PdxA, partial [Desulfonatronovibrio sp.]